MDRFLGVQRSTVVAVLVGTAVAVALRWILEDKKREKPTDPAWPPGPDTATKVR